MKEDLVKQIKQNKNYKELVSKRSTFSVALAIFILVIYYGYILTIAFEPSLLGTKIGWGVMTIGYPIGGGIIIVSFLCALIYVKRANTEFEDLISKIKNDIKDV
ncbi:MAG: hypothetical protein CR967_05010 [Proteobacteria bacterium]|nr:MAG: hypothetical protein CR967_05010 [Pseudomonadota bacterium]